MKTKSKKLTDFDTVDREAIEDELAGATSALGMNAWSHRDGGTLLADQIGICHNCKELQFCQSEFGNVLAKCRAFEGKLSGQNRITKCNQHSTRGAMEVSDMFAIATIIDLGEKKIKGFVGDQSDKRKAGFNVGVDRASDKTEA